MSIESPHTPIFLWGMPGVGKSTVGRVLAEQLGRHFVDLDERVVAMSGRDIPTLFAEEGEAGFRNREAQCLDALLESNTSAVIALGGGSLVDTDLRRRVREHGCLICLTADTSTLIERLGTGYERPLLANTGLEVAVMALHEARQNAYADCDVAVETGDSSVGEVISRVMSVVEQECAA